MDRILVLCALVGTTLIVVRGTIFGWLQKRWPKFFRCSQCVGMWVGLAAGAYGLESVGAGRLIDAFIVGATTSVLSLLTDAVLLGLLGAPED